MQSSLFHEPASLPNGLAFVPDFLAHGEERALLEGIRALELRAAQYKEYTNIVRARSSDGIATCRSSR